jgi:D-glycero-D-manno-heptose 1,7-bisphosphate phosphatase
VLVGGLGTRLGALTAATPKPLLPCGDRPFLAWLLREFCRFGIEEVVLLTGFLAERVEAAVPGMIAGLPKKLRVKCLREPQQAGTGGALFHARAHLAERFLLCNGDSWLDFNLARLLADAARDGPEVVGRMVLRQLDDASRYGVVETDGIRVVGFRERPEASHGPVPGTINTGIYLFDRAVLDAVSPLCSLEREVMPVLAARGTLRGTVADGYFIDIGVPTDFARAQTELPARLRRRALFLRHDGVINRDHGYVGSQDRFKLVPGAREAIRAASDAGWHVFIVTNQSDIAGGLYDKEQFTALMDWVVDEVRAAGGTIDDLCYCPMHPEAAIEAYRGHSDWRKPGLDMLRELLALWQLDPAGCVLIGDQPIDLAAAAAAAGMPGYLFDGDSLPDRLRRPPHLRSAS